MITVVTFLLSISVLMKDVAGRALTAHATVGLRQVSLGLVGPEGVAVVVDGGVGSGWSWPRTEVRPLLAVHDGHCVEWSPSHHLRVLVNLLIYRLTVCKGPVRVRSICGAVGVVVRGGPVGGAAAFVDVMLAGDCLRHVTGSESLS